MLHKYIRIHKNSKLIFHRFFLKFFFKCLIFFSFIASLLKTAPKVLIHNKPLSLWRKNLKNSIFWQELKKSIKYSHKIFASSPIIFLLKSLGNPYKIKNNSCLKVCHAHLQSIQIQILFSIIFITDAT